MEKELNGAAASELEKTILYGIQGAPDLRKEEKNNSLGVFPESILTAISKTQVKHPKINTDVEKAYADAKAKEIVVHGDLSIKDYGKYEKLADKYNLKFIIRYDHEFQGPVGLVVVGKDL